MPKSENMKPLEQKAVVVLSGLIFSLRWWLAASLCFSGTISGIILGLSGIIVNLTTAVAWFSGKPDLTWRGLSVGFGHLAPLAFSPAGEHSVWWGPVFWSLFGIQCWVRWHLGRRCTVTGPVWVSMVESGPYAWIRHPMTFVELLMAMTFALEFPSVRNIAVLAAVIVIKIEITRNEEEFLLQYEPYRDYASRVRWRWLPGIW